jgi:hypothetical protein
VIASNGQEAFWFESNRRSALGRRALAKAPQYNELLIERVKARLEEAPAAIHQRPGPGKEAPAARTNPPSVVQGDPRAQDDPSARPEQDGDPSKSTKDRRAQDEPAASGNRDARPGAPTEQDAGGERLADGCVQPANGASSSPWIPRTMSAPAPKSVENPWLAPALATPLPACEPAPVEPLPERHARRSRRPLDPVGRVRSIPDRTTRFVREAPLAAATTVLAAAAAAALLLRASAHAGGAPRIHSGYRASSQAIVQPAALPAAPVASVPLHRHRRHRHRHLGSPP